MPAKKKPVTAKPYPHSKDCMALLSELEDNSIGHINCDPPYNIGYDGGDKWDSFPTEEAYLDWCKQWIEECKRVLKPKRMMCIWGTQKSDTFLRLKLEVLNHINDLHSQNAIHWSYNWGGRGKTNFAHKFETAWCYSKGEEFLFNADAIRIERKMPKNIRTGEPYTTGTIPTTIGESNLKDLIKSANDILATKDMAEKKIEQLKQKLRDELIDYTDVWGGNLSTISEEGKESNFHPTVKPQFVLQRMIKAYSKKGEKVLDLFSGSGSTAVACLYTGREFIGSEANKEYHAKSHARINKHCELLKDATKSSAKSTAN